MYGQSGVGGGHIDLIVAAAGGKSAEGMEKHGLSGGGKACGHTGAVGLGDSGFEGTVRIVGPQLLGVDAAHQVAGHIADGLVLRHHVIEGQSEGIPAGAGILFVFANDFDLHGYAPLSVFDISQSLLRGGQSFGPNIFLGLRGVLALGLGKDGALALDGV